MIEIGIKTVYSIVLLAVTTFCLREVYLVWFDHPLQIGSFVGTKDGSDAPSMADSFRRLVVQQQNVLLDLYKGSAPNQGEFRFSSDVFPIHLGDLARLPGSSLDSLKIEAAGVNVTSLLTTLRRWIVAPNEITGSVDQISQQVIVSASWANPPRTRNENTTWQMLVLPTQSTLQAASFDLACRILYARIPPDHPSLKNVSEADFCTFSTALFKFKSYLSARAAAISDQDVAASNYLLLSVDKTVETLTTADTNLIFAYKLGGYVKLERANKIVNSDPNALKAELDKAQSLLRNYLERFVRQFPNSGDADAQEKLASLVARGGTLKTDVNLAQVNASEFLQYVNAALKTQGATTKAELTANATTLKPGMTIGLRQGNSAKVIGCFVEKDGKQFLLTGRMEAMSVGLPVITPALIDAAEHREIGKVVEIDGALSLVALEGTQNVSNDIIKGLASEVRPDEDVRLVGRSGISTGKVKAVGVDHILVDTSEGTLAFDGLVQATKLALLGNSGAPVLDSQDRLVGLYFVGNEFADNGVGISFLVPVQGFLNSRGLKLVQ